MPAEKSPFGDIRISGFSTNRDVPVLNLLITTIGEAESGKENTKESRRKKGGEPMRGIGQGKART